MYVSASFTRLEVAALYHAPELKPVMMNQSRSLAIWKPWSWAIPFIVNGFACS
jgi:hypothetical protein